MEYIDLLLIHEPTGDLMRYIVRWRMRIERMKENRDIFDFELTKEEMDRIAGLDTARSMFGWW